MAALHQTIATRQTLSQNLGLGAALAPSLHVLTLANDALADMLAEAALANPFLDVLPPLDRSAAIPRDFDDAAPDTLADHLCRQIAESGASPAVAACARGIAHSLEKRARLPDPEALRQDLPFPKDTFDAALALVRSLGPAGIAARDLRDCLALQLAEREDAEDARSLLDHLDLVARGERVRLSRRSGVPLERLGPALAMLASLRPDPSAGFVAPFEPIAPPDVVVRANGLGGWTVEVNEDAAPRIRIAPPPPNASGAADYVATMRSEARMLAHALTRRSITLFRVTSEIVRRQDAFLLHGWARLEPLSMREVGDALDLHESTISRAVQGKSVELPDGQMPLRDLFQQNLAGHAPSAIRARLVSIIAEHREETPLRDRDIVQALEREGISVARRTVAKYRARLHLPSSRERTMRVAAGSRC